MDSYNFYRAAGIKALYLINGSWYWMCGDKEKVTAILRLKRYK
jgi:hypothetical protein